MAKTLIESLEDLHKAWRDFMITVGEEFGIVRFLNWLEEKLQRMKDD